MNQTKKHTTGKKLLALLLALIMTVSLLPMSVFAAEPGAEETPVVEGQTQPAAETGADDADQAQEPDADSGEEDAVLPGDAEGDADDADAADDGIAAFAADGVAVQASTVDYRILHLDCGRKYFTKDWIIALLNEMSAAGYNQLELAFGNKGLRFLLDEKDASGNDITVGDYTMAKVNEAIRAGNQAYDTSVSYAPDGVEELTQTDMDAIIAHAEKLNIAIVPMFNTPFHMEAVTVAMTKLGISSPNLSKGTGYLNLNNSSAVSFVKALMQKYVDYFSEQKCSFFSFGADEYESWSSTFYTYAGEIASMIHAANMKTRVFNDSYRSNGGSTISGVDAVCYWTSGSDYATTKTVSQSASVINTNQDYYYVVNNSTQQSNWSPNAYYTFSGTYDEATWINHALTFSNTTYKNHGNTNSGASSVSPVGSMFCVWCDNPSHKDQTQIAKEIRMILRVMAARMDNKTTYSSSDVIVTGGFNADGTINGSSGGTEPETPVIKQDDTTVSGSKVQVAMGATTTLTLSGNKTATWSSSDEKILKLEAVSSKTRAAVAGTNAVQVVPVATGTAIVTAKLDDGAELSTEVTVTAAPEPTTVNIELKVGDTSRVYEGAAGATITTAGDDKVATAKLEPVQQDGDTTRTLDSLIIPAGTSGDGVTYKGVIATQAQDHFMVLSVENGKATLSDTTDVNAATIFEIKRYGNTKAGRNYDKQYGYSISANGYYLYGSSTLYPDLTAFTWYIGSSADYSVYARSGRFIILAYDNGWTTSQNWSKAGKAYRVKETTVEGKDVTNITFTGVKAGTTTYVIGGVTYVVTVNPKEVPVTLEEGDSVTYDVGNKVISVMPDKAIATATVKDGKLTLTGVKASDKTTSCTVGDTQYVITVVEKSSAAGTLLYVDLWVTNHGVLPDGDALEFANDSGTGTGNRRVTVQYEASKFASPDGQLLSDVLPKTGTDTANKIAARYWKTRYLPEATRQKTAGWTNKSGYGTDVLSGEAGGKDIERIRYYAGKWSYLPVDGTEWIDFNTSASNMVTQNESGAQIAAYYLLKTEVTKEVTTYITDWPDPHDTGSTAIYGVALDYCVKYLGDNVTRYPSEFGNDNENTHWFNCDGTIGGLADQNGYTVDANVANAAGWTGRRTNATTSQKNSYDDCYRVINNIEAIDTAEYEVYMITTTPSDSFDLKGYTQCPNTITYPTTREEVIWAIDDQAVTDSGLAKHAELVVGGTPRVNRVMIQQCSGLLLTYYVRAKSNVENLHVNYYDQDTGLLIHSYDIIPHETQTPNNFAEFKWNENDYSQGIISGNKVINNVGEPVTVQTDLKKVSGIAGKYQVGFALVEINKTDDNKTLNLYYKLDNSCTYVVDFGVPANVKRWGENDFTKISVEETTLYENRATTKKEVSKTNGKLYVDSDNELYYQLTTMQYTNPDVFNVTYTYADNTSNTYTVTFIPASNVYYEDDDAFITFAGGQGKADAAQWKVELDKGKTAADESKQIAEVLSKAKNVYGTDPTYENSTMFSLGRAHKVTVSADMVTDWNDNTCRWPTAEFTFKGTGFDVISLTDNKSGLLTYKVEKLETDGTWTIERQRFVSNYYDYGFKNGEWTNVESTDENALYQLPVVKVDGLTYGTYRVTLIVAYGELFDKTGNKEYSFWLDGVRIYDPAGPDLNNTYANDGEGWPKYIELHDELVKNDKNATTLFIEGDAQADIKAYTSYGPNHEVYLLNEQILAFKLANTAKVDKIHIGAKAPMGHATLKVNGQVIEPAIRTATDMYYDITKLVKDDGTVIITNADTAGDSILSLTQLKVTYTAEPTETGLASLAILTETEKQQVVQMVRAMYAPVEPEVFTPERFEASWNRSTVKVGQKATLTVKTSEDVEAITVDGVTIDTYRTRTQRTGWGWNAKRVTYREFTYTITAKEAGTLNCSVTAFNAENTASEPITAALTVQAAAQRPSWGGWLGNLFGRWF